MTVLKFPPPPMLTGELQILNRWLIELQSILNSNGLIDPSSVQTLPTTIAQVAANTASIGVLNGEVVILQARNQVLNGIIAPVVGQGVDGDWYADTVGKHIYVKVTGAWSLVI